MNTLMKNIFFGLEFDIDPVAFTIPGLNWDVYWYGIIITLGSVLAIIYGFKRAPKFGVDPDRLSDCVIVTLPCAIAGGRLYYIAFDPDTTIVDFFKIHDGGMAILGAVIAAALVGALMCKLRKVNIFAALDLASLGFLLGQGIGRWGNFINQEAYGTPTGSTWFGISGERIVSDSGIAESLSLMHPCFLYESIWCLLGFVILHKLSKKRAFAGESACMYLVWYGFGRMIIEGFRTDTFMGGQVRISQLVSGLMYIAGILLIVVLRRAAKINQKAPVYEMQFDAVEETHTVEDTDIEQAVNVSAEEEFEDGTDNQR